MICATIGVLIDHKMRTQRKNINDQMYHALPIVKTDPTVPMPMRTKMVFREK